MSLNLVAVANIRREWMDRLIKNGGALALPNDAEEPAELRIGEAVFHGRVSNSAVPLSIGRMATWTVVDHFEPNAGGGTRKRPREMESQRLDELEDIKFDGVAPWAEASLVDMPTSLYEDPPAIKDDDAMKLADFREETRTYMKVRIRYLEVHRKLVAFEDVQQKALNWLGNRPKSMAGEKLVRWLAENMEQAAKIGAVHRSLEQYLYVTYHRLKDYVALGSLGVTS